MKFVYKEYTVVYLGNWRTLARQKKKMFEKSNLQKGS